MTENRVLYGDCRETLKTLPDQSAQCCITSPPYFGLRDYGTAKWEGGDAACDHIAPPTGGPSKKGNRGKFSADGQFHHMCRKCGAARVDSQIGLEQTPEEYVAEMVAVFREVRRVLRDDGVLWMNLGDSYSTNGERKNNNGAGKSTMGWPGQSVNTLNKAVGISMPKVETGLKPKDLIGIPWRVAFALQADGWYLRQDIIWAKPNPMPESVTDRCTKAHEYLFLLSKSQRYHFDAEAIAEPAYGGAPGNKKPVKGAGEDDVKFRTREGLHNAAERARLSVAAGDPMTRNRRSVWTVATQPFSGAHFAVMPPELVKPCVLAGCPVGGVVLDPFFGSGTVGMVAESLGRQWIGCELNTEYRPLIEQRTSQIGMGI